MSDVGKNFVRKKELAVAALLSTRTIGEAAKQSHVSEATLWRWLKNPEFAERLARAKSEILGGVINRLRSGGNDCAETLHSLATDPNTPATARVSAARSLVEFLFQAHDIEVMEARLTALENKLLNQKTEF